MKLTQKFALVSILAIIFVGFITTKTIEEDVVIIGSGFGGSIMAYRLSQIGVKVTILEKGREWKITDPTKNETFPLLLTPDERAAWFRNFTVAPGAPPYFGTPIGVSTGLLEYITEEVNTLDPGIKVRATGVSVNNGVGVGGGSLIYNAAIVQPTEENFNTVWDDPMWEGLYSDLEDSYWPKVTKMFKQSPIPDSILDSVYYKNARVFQEQANNAGFDDSSNWDQSPRHALYKLNLGIDWDVVQEEIEGKKVSAAIVGEIWYGINSGAKFSLDRPGNYLDLALSSSYVTLQSLHLVDDISYNSQTKKYSVHALILDQSSGEVVNDVTYVTKKLIMSAGSVMTSSLLVRAKGLGKLDQLNEEVGKEWGNNGDAFGFRFASEGDINPSQGGPASFGMAFDDASDSTILMNIPVKWGPANNLTNIIGTLSMGIPHPSNGVFSYDSTNDVVTLTWPTSPRSDEDSYNAAQDAYSALNNANAGTSGQLDPINSAAAVTGHPMGGVVYGKATDFNCRVKGYEGLYVVDGSLVPGAAGTVNPAFVIAGMSELCAEKIISAEFAEYSSAFASSSSSASFLIPSLSLFFLYVLFV